MEERGCRGETIPDPVYQLPYFASIYKEVLAAKTNFTKKKGKLWLIMRASSRGRSKAVRRQERWWLIYALGGLRENVRFHPAFFPVEVLKTQSNRRENGPGMIDGMGE